MVQCLRLGLPMQRVQVRSLLGKLCQVAAADENLNEPSNPSPGTKLDSWTPGQQRFGLFLPLSLHRPQLMGHLTREVVARSLLAQPLLAVLHSTFPTSRFRCLLVPVWTPRLD